MNITNAMLDEYSDERIEDDDRPVLIDPGIWWTGRRVSIPCSGSIHW